MNRVDDFYSIYVVPDETTEGSPCYLASHPDLQGCMSHGATVNEALQGLHAARKLYLTTLQELGQQIPPPSKNQTVIVWENLSGTLTVSPALDSRLPTTELRKTSL